MQRKNTAFTLVELIVVITILAILGTIAFISMSGYSAISRDSVRLTDVGTMKTSLEIYQVNSGKYPLPDDNGEFTYSGETLWSQGEFGEIVVGNLSRNINEAPRDPLSEKLYVYSVAGNRNEFQIVNLLESDDLVLNNVLETKAAGVSVRTPKLTGTYNGLYVKTSKYIVPLPSIITSEEVLKGTKTEITGTGMTSLVTSGGGNIPRVGNVNYSVGKLEGIKLTATGVVSATSTEEEKASVVLAIQEAYSGTTLANEGIYKYVLNIDSSNTELLAGVLDTVVLGNSTNVAVTTNNANEEQVIENNDPLYVFSSHIFTNCGQLGNLGPVLSQCKNEYSTVWDENTSNYNITNQGYQLWTVPKSGVYKLEVWGAQGGPGYSGTAGGKGGYAIGEISLSKSEILTIVVGQEGRRNTNKEVTGGFNGGGNGGDHVLGGFSNENGGGGGATDVRRGGSDLLDRIIVAGGGGGTVTDDGIDGIGGYGGGLTGESPNSGSRPDIPSYIAQGGGQSCCALGSPASHTVNVTGNGQLGIGGYGADWNINSSSGGGSGGGGGYYGGGGGTGVYGHPGGGGSSYINGLDNASTTSNNNVGHGKVKITFLY